MTRRAETLRAPHGHTVPSTRRHQAKGRTVRRAITWRDPEGRQRAQTHANYPDEQARQPGFDDPRSQERLVAAGAEQESLREATKPWWTDRRAAPRSDRSTQLRPRPRRHLLHVGVSPIHDTDPALVLALQAADRRSLSRF